MRRDRFNRTLTGKRLTLMPRDKEILRWLYRYRYLRQDHLQRVFTPKSPKRLTERLGDLFHETGLINRPLIQAPLFDARATPMLYEISAKGIKYLEALEALPLRAVTFSTRPRDAYSPQFLHTLAIIETLLETELDCISSPEKRFVPVDEILASAPESTRTAKNPLALPVMVQGRATSVIPDALYGIEYSEPARQGFRFFALEVERTSPVRRSNPTASSTAKKQTLYDHINRHKLYADHWNIPNLELRLIS